MARGPLLSRSAPSDDRVKRIWKFSVKESAANTPSLMAALLLDANIGLARRVWRQRSLQKTEYRYLIYQVGKRGSEHSAT